MLGQKTQKAVDHRNSLIAVLSSAEFTGGHLEQALTILFETLDDAMNKLTPSE